LVILIQGQQRVWRRDSTTMMEETMAVIIIGIVAAWVVFSALLVTVICINSSQLSRIEEPFKARSAKSRSQARKLAAQLKSSQVQTNAETT
jgi:predicted negative regulator of RcsB-dependent stress response